MHAPVMPRWRDREGGERCRNEQPKARKLAAAGHVIANWKVLGSIIPPRGPSRRGGNATEKPSPMDLNTEFGAASHETLERINRHERTAIPDIGVLSYWCLRLYGDSGLHLAGECLVAS